MTGRRNARRSLENGDPSGASNAFKALPESTGAEAAYKLTTEEHAAVERYKDKQKKSAPRLKIDDGYLVSTDHPDHSIGLVRLMEAIGTSDEDFLQGLLKQVVGYGCKGKDVDESQANFLLSVIKGVEPKDQIESMLAAQMAAIHSATMTMARRLAQVETLPRQDSAERALNKLARTFAAQVEALKRYRTGGQQKVTVEHVTVNAGGQAIVGNVDTKESATGSQSPRVLSDQSGGAFEMDRLTNKEETPISRGSSNGRKPQLKH